MSNDYYYNPDVGSAILKLDSNEIKEIIFADDQVTVSQYESSEPSFIEFLNNHHLIERYVADINRYMPKKSIDFRSVPSDDIFDLKTKSTPHKVTHALQVGSKNICDYTYNKESDKVLIARCSKYTVLWGDFLKEIYLRGLFIKLVESWRKMNL